MDDCWYMRNVYIDGQSLLTVRDMFRLEMNQCLQIQQISRRTGNIYQGQSLSRFIDFILLHGEYEYIIKSTGAFADKHLLRPRIPKTFMIRAESNNGMNGTS